MKDMAARLDRLALLLEENSSVKTVEKTRKAGILGVNVSFTEQGSISDLPREQITGLKRLEGKKNIDVRFVTSDRSGSGIIQTTAENPRQ